MVTEINLANILNVVKKKFIVLFSFYIFSFLLGIIIANFLPKEYQIELVLKMPYILNRSSGEKDLLLNSDELGTIIDSLKQTLSEGRYKELSSLLSVSISDVKKITGFRMKSIAGGDAVELDIQSYDPRILRKVEKGLVEFLQSLPAVRVSITKEKESLLKAKKIYQQLINKAVEKNKIREGKVSIVVLDGEQAKVMAAEQLQKIDFFLMNISNFKLVFSSGIPSRPFKPKKLLFAAGFLMFAIFLSFFWILFLAYGIETGEEK